MGRLKTPASYGLVRRSASSLGAHADPSLSHAGGFLSPSCLDPKATVRPGPSQLDYKTGLLTAISTSLWSLLHSTRVLFLESSQYDQVTSSDPPKAPDQALDGVLPPLVGL